jgi:hypothetical protein
MLVLVLVLVALSNGDFMSCAICAYTLSHNLARKYVTQNIHKGVAGAVRAVLLSVSASRRRIECR